MADPVTVKLRKPIKFGDETITQLTIRPLTGKDVRRLKTEKGFEMDTTLMLASRLSGQPNPVIDELEGEDLVEVMMVVNGFFATFQATGSEPSP